MLDGMTNIKASEVLKEIKYYTEDLPPYSPDEVAEALEMAIKALEQQPSEDAVSREAVLNGLANIAKAKAKSDAQKALMGRVMFFTEHLPSVIPQRPKGKWIEIEIDAGEFIYKCTKCGMRVINPYKYCPNCGAEMSGGGEDEVSD